MPATAMKSVNVFRLRSRRPSSHHRRPPSPPPRMCATAYTKPRSSRLGTATLNSGHSHDSYAPYPYSRHGAVPPRWVPAR